MIIEFKAEEITQALKLGQVICFPTDTLFALSCDASNYDAIHKLFALKQRDKNKTMPILVADLATAMEIVHFDPVSLKLAQSFWPGPLTLVLEAKNTARIAPLLIAEDFTIAIRVPN